MTNVGPLTLEQCKAKLKEGFINAFKVAINTDVRAERMRSLGIVNYRKHLEDQLPKNLKLTSPEGQAKYKEIQAAFEKPINEEVDKRFQSLKIDEQFDPYFEMIIEKYSEEAILNIPPQKLIEFAGKLSRALKASLPENPKVVSENILKDAVSILRTDLFNAVSFFDKYAAPISKVTGQMVKENSEVETNFTGYIAKQIQNIDLEAPKDIRFEQSESVLHQANPRYINPILLSQKFSPEQAEKFFKAYANLVAGMLAQMGKNGKPFVKDDKTGKGIESIPIIAICEVASQLALNPEVQNLDDAQQRIYGTDLAKQVGKDQILNIYKDGFNIKANPKVGQVQQGAVAENAQEAIVTSFNKAIADKMLNVEFALAYQMKKETATKSKSANPTLDDKTKVLAGIYNELIDQKAKKLPIDIDKAVSETFKKVKVSNPREVLQSITIPGVTLKLPTQEPAIVPSKSQRPSPQKTVVPSNIKQNSFDAFVKSLLLIIMSISKNSEMELIKKLNSAVLKVIDKSKKNTLTTEDKKSLLALYDKCKDLPGVMQKFDSLRERAENVKKEVNVAPSSSALPKPITPQQRTALRRELLEKFGEQERLRSLGPDKKHPKQG